MVIVCMARNAFFATALGSVVRFSLTTAYAEDFSTFTPRYRLDLLATLRIAGFVVARATAHAWCEYVFDRQTRKAQWRAHSCYTSDQNWSRMEAFLRRVGRLPACKSLADYAPLPPEPPRPVPSPCGYYMVVARSYDPSVMLDCPDDISLWSLCARYDRWEDAHLAALLLRSDHPDDELLHTTVILFPSGGLNPRFFPGSDPKPQSNALSF